MLQVYEGLVYMDFSKELMEEHGFGTDLPVSAINVISCKIKVVVTSCLCVFSIIRSLHSHGHE